MPTPPSSAPTVQTALDVVETMEGIRKTGAGPDAGARITGVAPDRDARVGDLSWISPPALASDSTRSASFEGTFLILPDGSSVRPSCAFAVAKEPRLVFSRLVGALFPERVRTRWPHAPASVADDAHIADDVRLGPGVVVGEGVEMAAGVEVGPHTVLTHCTLEAGVRIGPNCTIGTDGFGYTRDARGVLVPFPHLGRVVIEADATIGANTCIDRGALGETRIGARTRVDNLVHIAHNVRIGADCAIIAHAMIAGGVVIGDGAWVAPAAAVRNQKEVGAGALVGLGAVVTKDVAPGQTVAGNPARPLGS